MLHYLNYSNELVPVVGDTGKEDAALTVGTTSLYFPRIKLCQGQAREVQKQLVEKGGNYALISGKTDVEDLGDSVDMVICAGRAKALRTGDVIMSVFDHESEEFQKIKEESKDKNSGSMYGPEYLVFLPDVGEEGTFATLFLSNPTMRRESKTFHARLRKAATVTSHLIETKEHAWFGPLCNDCSTPLDLPSSEVFEEAISRFNNEKPSQVATVDESDGSERER